MRWVTKSTDYALGGASFLAVGGMMLVSDFLTLARGGSSLTTFAVFAGVGGALVGIGARWFFLSMAFYRAERIGAGGSRVDPR